MPRHRKLKLNQRQNQYQESGVDATTKKELFCREEWGRILEGGDEDNRIKIRQPAFF